MNDVQNRFERPRPHGVLLGIESGFPPRKEIPALDNKGHALSNRNSAPYFGQVLNIAIAFYTNGVFTVNDGAPRSIDDPANSVFLDQIRQGICPVELSSATERPVKVHLVRYGTDYKPPQKPNTSTFAGPVKTHLHNTGEANSQHVKRPPSGVEQGEWEGADESKATTSLQILLPDGSRVVARFNLNHTIRDIRRFVAALRSDVSHTGPLESGYPSREIPDEGQTIEDAGLVNAVVILK